MQLALRSSSRSVPSSASIRQKWCGTGPRKGFARGCRHIGSVPPVSAVFQQVGKQIAQFMQVSAMHVPATRACLYCATVTRPACKLCVHAWCKALLRVYNKCCSFQDVLQHLQLVSQHTLLPVDKSLCPTCIGGRAAQEVGIHMRAVLACFSIPLLHLHQCLLASG